MSDISLFEAIHSARALRRLKPDPVPEDLLTKVLDAAIRAPSAGNAQSWSPMPSAGRTRGPHRATDPSTSGREGMRPVLHALFRTPR